MNYLLQITLCWGLFALLYAALLRRETFFRANRAYLLLSSLAGLALPLLAPYCVWPAPAPDHPGESPVYALAAWTTYVVSTMEPETKVPQASFSALQGLQWIWLIGSAWFAARFLWGLYRLWRLRLEAEPDFSPEGDLIYRSEAVQTPFSFLHWVFIPYYYEQIEGYQGILAHEQAHARERHSLDVLWAEILCVVWWFHPLAHWYRRALRNVHEYAADAASARRFSRKQYGLLLIRQSQSGPAIAFANHFFQSPLKQRLIMLTKQKSARAQAWRYVPVLPLLLLLVLLLQKTPASAQQERPQSMAKEKAPATQPSILNGEAIFTYISQNLKYPAAARAEKREGEVMVQFYLEKDGSLSDVRCVKPENAGDLGIEAVRVVKSIPKWIPVDNQDSIAQRVIFAIPVRFRLDAEKTEQTLVKPDNKQTDGDDLTQLFDCAVMPVFPSGEEGMQAYLRNTIKYPEAAKKEGRQGTVVLKFVIEKDGSLTNIHSVRPEIPDDLVAEAIRVVQAMPKWTPGADKDGHLVRVSFALPIRFKLQ